MTCPHLTYETSDDEHEFEHERPYCSVVEEFVQPLRSDICNDTGDLSHDTHCEIYLEHASSD